MVALGDRRRAEHCGIRWNRSTNLQYSKLEPPLINHFAAVLCFWLMHGLLELASYACG